MALTDESGMNTTMLVSPAGGQPYPVYMNGGNSGGFGDGFGGSGWWILLLFLLIGNNGWGNNGFMGGGNNNDLYPWMNQANLTSNGFQNQLLNDNVTSIRDGINGLSTQMCSGFGDIQNSLCNGFAGVNATVNSGFANAETAANARQMANMQQAFAAQTAMSQGFNQLGSQFANCCCENRLGIADLKYTVATENCADRAALSDGIRDVITNQTANTQRILDQLCNDKIDAKNEKIADLERQLTMANLAASQTAQTARLENSNSATVDALYNRLATCPVGTMPVYGNQPIFTCPNNNGCGCNF